MIKKIIISTIAILSLVSIAEAAIYQNGLPPVTTIASGGTGTSTAPSYGQILVGNSGGTYSLTATSSLGIGGLSTSSISAAFPITWNTSNAQIGFNGLSTTTQWSNGQIAYVSGNNTVTSIGTSSMSIGNGLSGFNFNVIGSGSTLALNLANLNTWTGLQQFQGQASSTLFSCYGPCYFGATATSTFTTAGRLGILNSSPSYPLDVSGFINTDQYSGYKQNGNTVLYASTTNNSLAIGSSAAAGWMSATSTSFQDISIGSGSMMATPINSAAINNVAIGFQAYQNNTSGAGNVALGTNALRANTSGSNNMSIGSYSLAAVTTGHDNVGIGTNALGNDTTGNADTIIGSNAGQAELGNNNTFIGYGAGQGSGTPSDTGNVFLGAFSGNQNTGSFLNTCVGYFSCYNLTSGNGNVSIGDGANVISPTGSNQLNLANVLYGTNIYGAFSQSSSPTTNGTLGVSTSTTFSKFAVSLNSSDTLGYAFVVSSSTASATTTPFGVSNTGWIVTSGGLPTASACGTTQSISGNQTSGDVMLTGAAVTTCTINFPNPVPAGTTLQCTVTDNSTVSTVSITATTTSSFTAGFPTGLNTATIWWQCTASRNANN